MAFRLLSFNADRMRNIDCEAFMRNLFPRYDVICAQEVDIKQLLEWFPDYKCISAGKRDKDVGFARPVTLVRRKLFTVVWRSRHNRTLPLLLRSIDTPMREIMVINVHLKADHYPDDFSADRTCMMNSVVKKIKKSYPIATTPTVVCGDFNCGLDEKCIELLEGIDNVALKNDDWTLVSRRTGTTRIVDHIFATMHMLHVECPTTISAPSDHKALDCVVDFK